MISKSSLYKVLSFVLACGLPGIVSQASEQAKPWSADAFASLTEARICTLRESERAVWQKYLDASREKAKVFPALARTDFLEAPELSGARRSTALREGGETQWYGTEEAGRLAMNVCAWQSPVGGWTKCNDYSVQPEPNNGKTDIWSAGTFDNNATVLELRFLARVITGLPDDPRSVRWREVFLKGLEYIFSAQYPNGGFPQIYPLVGSYHDAITLNDDAMFRVLRLLRDISEGRAEFAFVSSAQRAESSRRLARGIDCLLKMQIIEPSGRRTAWCQQHDMLTLKPCAARGFEPIAAASNESASLLKLLMDLPAPPQEVVRAVDDAVAWLEKNALRNAVWKEGRLEPKEGANLLWARFYEIGSDKPIFGDRDCSIHYDIVEISEERRKGYGWFGHWPGNRVKNYKNWRESVSNKPKT